MLWLKYRKSVKFIMSFFHFMLVSNRVLINILPSKGIPLLPMRCTHAPDVPHCVKHYKFLFFTFLLQRIPPAAIGRFVHREWWWYHLKPLSVTPNSSRLYDNCNRYRPQSESRKHLDLLQNRPLFFHFSWSCGQRNYFQKW